jgi:peptidoglycan/LPS O-acetylase OafA/YrhL
MLSLQLSPATVPAAGTALDPTTPLHGRLAVSKKSHTRYASLDLLRALAIVVVVNCHSGSAFAAESLSHVLQLGGKGVELFFVLSGWLLGRQLILEVQRTGRIDMVRFWSRRWLRTLPAYYAVLLLVSVWILYRGNQPLRPEYLFFGQTYLTGMPYFGISWSLCVEEHFYLLVAPTLLLMWRFSRVRLILPVLVLIPSLCRVMKWFGADYQTHVWYDACAAGVLLAACSVAWPQCWQSIRSAAKWVALAAAIVVVKDVAVAAHPAWRQEWGPIAANYGILSYAVVFASWVWAAAVHPDWSIARLPGVRYLAERSYAVYLLHLEVITAVRHLQPLPFLVSLSIVWIGSLVVAEILYRTVERPGMRLRDRFSISRQAAASV